ncbi:MAG: hypothetical protein A3F18_02780 [Legionellales bacterium RIFCSPHIGHO2_12_FULL_37_14]|nr:MAG: hypothetical protein A3F18_02780 [Legionellales bacterium RIFCSPHIGHO2_12_FULL_37_14]
MHRQLKRLLQFETTVNPDMHILLTGPEHFDQIHGGGQVYIRHLAAGLIEKNHNVIYISLAACAIEQPDQVRVRNDSIEEYKLLFPQKWFHDASSPKSALIKHLAEIIKTINPDIIHAHAWKQYFCLASTMANKPCIVTAHHGGIVCPAGALLKADDTICDVPAHDTHCLKCCVKQVPGFRIWYLLLRYIPCAIRLRLGRFISKLPFIPFLTPLGLMTGAIREKAQSVFYIGAYASKIIAPSPAIAKSLIRNDIPENKICVIPHGIPRIAKRPLIGNLHSRFIRFVFSGRISYEKGLHILLQACSMLSGCYYELHILGAPVGRQATRYYHDLRQIYKLKNIIWYGHKQFDDMLNVISDCDIMIHPALCLEVFGLSIAEALAVGRPVIATRCGGPEIQIRDGENGLLIKPNDPHALADAMQRFIVDPGLVQVMAQQIENVNTIENHVIDLEKVYQSVLFV